MIYNIISLGNRSRRDYRLAMFPNPEPQAQPSGMEGKMNKNCTVPIAGSASGLQQVSQAHLEITPDYPFDVQAGQEFAKYIARLTARLHRWCGGISTRITFDSHWPAYKLPKPVDDLVLRAELKWRGKNLVRVYRANGHPVLGFSSSFENVFTLKDAQNMNYVWRFVFKSRFESLLQTEKQALDKLLKELESGSIPAAI